MKKEPEVLPGRPATIRGRSTVVSLILSEASASAIDEQRGSSSLGDAVEALILSSIDKVKKQPIAPAQFGRPKPMWFTDRTIQRRVRLSETVKSTLEASAKSHGVAMSDVVEALIRQFPHKVKKGKR